MRIKLLSDIHLEFNKWPKRFRDTAETADVVVLAGDIGVGMEGIAWALATFDCPVIYVMGNHEFYGKYAMQELHDKARERTEGTHVHVLENESVVIDDVRFLGCTLWTDFDVSGDENREECMNAARYDMTDYQRICETWKGKMLTVMNSIYEGGQTRTYARGDLITPEITRSRHVQSRAFLASELKRDAADIGCRATVVVTHHAPSILSLEGEEVRSKLDAAYASNLEALVAQSDCWMHGHLHHNTRYQIGRATVVSNCRGYADAGRYAAKGFRPNLMINV